MTTSYTGVQACDTTYVGYVPIRGMSCESGERNVLIRFLLPTWLCWKWREAASNLTDVSFCSPSFCLIVTLWLDNTILRNMYLFMFCNIDVFDYFIRFCIL